MFHRFIVILVLQNPLTLLLFSTAEARWYFAHFPGVRWSDWSSPLASTATGTGFFCRIVWISLAFRNFDKSRLSRFRGAIVLKHPISQTKLLWYCVVLFVLRLLLCIRYSTWVSFSFPLQVFFRCIVTLYSREDLGYFNCFFWSFLRSFYAIIHQTFRFEFGPVWLLGLGCLLCIW